MRKSTGCKCTGEGGVCPRQEGLHQGFLMNQHDTDCPNSTGCFSRSRAAVLMNNRYLEQEGQSPQVSPRCEVIFHPSWAKMVFMALSSLEPSTTTAKRARVQRKAI